MYFANCCFYSCAAQSHKDSVREVTVEDQLRSKTIRPVTTAQLHLPPLDLAWTLDREDDDDDMMMIDDDDADD